MHRPVASSTRVALTLVALAFVLMAWFAAARGGGDGRDRATPGARETRPNAWTLVAPMPQRRSYFASAELGGYIYVAGGMVESVGRHLDAFARYDPRRDRWTALPSLPVRVRACAGAALGGDFYVAGGTTPAGGGRAVFRYRVAERRWQRVAPLPSPRFNHALVAFDGGLWAIGGYWAPHASSEVFVYDPAANRWRRGPALPRQVQTAAAVVYRGDLWLIGGRRGTKPLTEVQVLRPGGKSWRPGPAMPKPMELLGADVSRDRIHALWEGTYQVYDPATGWALGPSPQVPRHSVALFATDRDLVAVGGCTVQLEDSNVVERLALATGGASH